MSALPRLHVIVDVSPQDDGTRLADAALAGGAPLVQVRAKGFADDRTRLAHSQALVGRCHRAGAAVIVNDRADVAVATGAEGVHGGADDLPGPVLRSIVGDRRLVGLTARDPDTARAHEQDGADYLGVGPVYATPSKSGLPDPFGPDALGRIAASVSIPVIAIGGITVERVHEVLDAGAHGVAVIGAVAGAADPCGATVELVEALGGQA